MGDAQGQRPALPQTLEPGALRLMGEVEVDLRPHLPGAAQRIGRQRPVKLPVTVRRVVKVGDGLMQGFGREIPQLPLKTAEGDGALVKIRRGLGFLQAEAVLNKIVDPPEFALLVPIPAAALPGGHQVEAGPGIRVSGGKIRGHGLHVFHEPRDIGKGGPAQALENVALPIGGHQIGAVDVPLTVALAAERRSAQAKMG